MKSNSMYLCLFDYLFGNSLIKISFNSLRLCLFAYLCKRMKDIKKA